MGHYILVRHFLDQRTERSDWTGEETLLRRGAYFPDPSTESDWIVTKPPHVVEDEPRLVFVVEQIKLPITGVSPDRPNAGRPHLPE